MAIVVRGQMVTVLPFYSDYGGLNPAEVYSFYSLQMIEKTERRPGMVQLKKTNDLFDVFYLGAERVLKVSYYPT